jgi:hypothetical protein
MDNYEDERPNADDIRQIKSKNPGYFMYQYSLGPFAKEESFYQVMTNR